jgi:SAM-dependent methyltransferase
MNISDKIWNLIAPVYGILRNNPISGYYYEKERRASYTLLQHLDSSEFNTICDLGVGRGHSLDLASGGDYTKIALDKSMSMIRHTRGNYIDSCFVVGNVLNLPIKNSSLDLIICIGITEYISDLGPLLLQIRAALKNEKFLLISFSPKNLFTYLRILNGHRIHARNSTKVKKNIEDNQFKILDKKITATQYQYLLKKQ